MSKRTVVVTGLGMITALGNTVETTWANILEGKSGASAITSFDSSDFSVNFAATVKGFHVTDYLAAKEAKKMDIFIQYGIAAACQAIADAGLELSDEEKERTGVAIGSGIGGLDSIESTHTVYNQRGARKISPFFIPSTIINMVAGNLAIKFGLRGPNISIVTACTSGTHNIGMAARMIQSGDADRMVAGGAEYASTPLGIGGFASLRALSTRNEAPTEASRPFDRDRDGFVLGDGAGVVVLEELEAAKARGAKIYAKLVGFGMSDDAFHMTMPAENGRGAVTCMRNALKDAQLQATDVDYINAHGTSTAANDKIETAAIKEVFTDHAYKVAISSTKSMSGHTLGAAGAIESIFCLLAMRDKVVPPTINLHNPDEDCDLDYTAHTAKNKAIRYCLNNSFGFGGTNGSLIFASTA